MSEEYKLTFNPGDPIDATKLEQLLKFINEVNSKAIKIPSGTDIAGDVVNAIMTMGSHSLRDINNEGGRAKPYTVPFARRLAEVPMGVIVTLESASDMLDLTYSIKDITRDGFVIMLNPIVGLTKDYTTYLKEQRWTEIKVHYFAIANPSL